jgi:hypothetical protein
LEILLQFFCSRANFFLVVQNFYYSCNFFCKQNWILKSCKFSRAKYNFYSCKFFLVVQIWIFSRALIYESLNNITYYKTMKSFLELFCQLKIISPNPAQYDLYAAVHVNFKRRRAIENKTNPHACVSNRQACVYFKTKTTKTIKKTKKLSSELVSLDLKFMCITISLK